MKIKMREAGEQANFEKFCDRVYTKLCDSGLDPEVAGALLDKYGDTIVKDSFTNGRNAVETAAAVNSVRNDESKSESKKGESIYDSFSDYIDAVVDTLVWKLDYGPETAHAFACDDFKDITRAGFADGKSAKDTAAAIDARYMDGSDGSDKSFDKVLI